jgi:hypothetical protein
MSTRLHTRSVAEFQCLGDRCPDTCCQGWGMQLSRDNVAKYEREAPELLDAVSSGESEFIMRRDEVGACVKLEGGWCGIHKKYGASFLGDACYFFPRLPRMVADTAVLGGALSCPEMMRLVLEGASPFDLVPREDERLPTLTRDCCPEGVSPDAALAVHRSFLEAAADETVTPERAFARISTVARSLDALPPAQWPQALPLYLRLADGRLPVAEPSPNDPFLLLQSVRTLVGGAARPRLEAALTRMAGALGCAFNGITLTPGPDAPTRLLQVLARMRTPEAQPLMRRFLQAQLSENFFPFGGIGQGPIERATILGVRFATARLALACQPAPTAIAAAEMWQPLARFLDHLADPTDSLNHYRQAGWLRESRLRALVGDDVA